MIYQQLVYQLSALSDVLEALTSEQFTAKIRHLRNASIGEHTRHIIEILHCLQNGYSTGQVDYINRVRDLELQSNRLKSIGALKLFLVSKKMPDKKLKLVTETNFESEIEPVYTTYYREIVYQAEHVIHHLALIQVSLLELELNVAPPDFGLAYSTIKYKTSLQNKQLQN